MRVDKNFYPGWVRKSITFTIDDGNIELDKKFIDIVKPYGIKGTFNLCSPNLTKYTRDFYREFYSGFGISNHCKLHPFALTSDKIKPISEDKFDPDTADHDKLYKTDISGLYHFRASNGWRRAAESQTYCRLVKECHEELTAIFGEGSIKSFVWPFSEQADDIVQDFVMNKMGYISVRRTGERDSFNVPSDRMHWSYNSRHCNIMIKAKEYERIEDDGELKMFTFGVHSHDFERDGLWDLLSEFAAEYGAREKEFWYASVDDIFEYSDAVRALKISDTEIVNDSDKDIYITVDSKKKIIPAHTRLTD